jgi:hypothetical protein
MTRRTRTSTEAPRLICATTSRTKLTLGTTLAPGELRQPPTSGSTTRRLRGALPASEGRQWRTRADLAGVSYALSHKRGSASVPRDPAQRLYSAHVVLPTAADVRRGRPERQSSHHAEHKWPYQILGASGVLGQQHGTVCRLLSNVRCFSVNHRAACGRSSPERPIARRIVRDLRCRTRPQGHTAL